MGDEEPMYAGLALSEVRARYAPGGEQDLLMRDLVSHIDALRGDNRWLREALAASQQRERTASEAYHRQQGAQRELEALYQRAVEEREAGQMRVAELQEELRDAEELNARYEQAEKEREEL